MDRIIGIRREDKSKWERRTPLIPEHVQTLKSQGIRTILQPSPIRVFRDAEYIRAQAQIEPSLQAAGTVLAIKEIPVEYLEPGKTYVFFSHVIKGQAHNMPMLRRLMELGCNLIDYERIINTQNQRLIFFGRYAGLAGMIETLHAFARKLDAAKIKTPLIKLQQAYQYPSVEAAKEAVRALGKEIRSTGLPRNLGPVVTGFAGYGHVSQGAQEIYDLLPQRELQPGELLFRKTPDPGDAPFVKVVFREKDMVTPLSGRFDLQDYYDHPQRYQSRFEQYLPLMQILVNCIYWTPKYPRLVTRQYLRDRYHLNPTLKVIGDISCDIEGSIEITTRPTEPDQPTFTYHPGDDSFTTGTAPDGMTVMAIDNLPCEFPRESSREFSAVLLKYVQEIATADYSQPYEKLNLSFPIRNALIIHQGKLTPDYRYLTKFLNR